MLLQSTHPHTSRNSVSPPTRFGEHAASRHCEPQLLHTGSLKHPQNVSGNHLKSNAIFAAIDGHNNRTVYGGDRGKKASSTDSRGLPEGTGCYGDLPSGNWIELARTARAHSEDRAGLCECSTGGFGPSWASVSLSALIEMAEAAWVGGVL